LALRYCHPDTAPAGATRMFGEVVTPAVGRGLAEQAARGLAPPLAVPSDLVHHTLLEEDDHRPSAEFLGWRHWLRVHGVPQLEPARWLLLNFTYQQVQAALSGQGVALARLPLVAETLERGELVEPFGSSHRLVSPFAYWMIEGQRGAAVRAEVTLFARWLLAQAEQTRRDTDLAVNAVAA
jgi:LysR family transcriptional regulator, glycine cleavage system transcriptional activator